MTIHNDQEFKQALSELSIADQRLLSARFIVSVEHLNPDPLIASAVKVAHNKMHTQSEFDAAYKSIKLLAVNTYTACGGDVDWPAQAAHFVATAAKACLTPSEHLANKTDLAWKCAMQTRMAKNCEMIESDTDNIENEAQKQYTISDIFLNL